MPNLPLNLRLDLAILSEAPLTPEDKAKLDKIVKTLQELRDQDFRKLAFGRGLDHYIDNIAREVTTIKKYSLQGIDQSKQIIEALVRKHPDIVSITAGGTLNITQPHGTLYNNINTNQWRPSSITHMIKQIDELLSSSAYDKLRATVEQLEQMGIKRNKGAIDLQKMKIKTQYTTICIESIAYSGPRLMMRNWGEDPENPGRDLQSDMPRMIDAITTKDRVRIDILDSQKFVDNCNITHLQEIAETIDTAYSAITQLFANGHYLGDSRSLVHIIANEDGTVQYKIPTTPPQFIDSNDIVSTKRLINQIIQKIREEADQEEIDWAAV